MTPPFGTSPHRPEGFEAPSVGTNVHATHPRGSLGVLGLCTRHTMYALACLSLDFARNLATLVV
jgi:hypothetical protein